MVRKRSAYRPRPTLLQKLVNAAPIADAEILQTFKLRNHSSLTLLSKGQGGALEVSQVSNALAIAQALASIGLGDEWSNQLLKAHTAVSALSARAATTGKFVFTGPELTAVNLGMEVHDCQLDQCTVAQLEEAVASLVKSILRSKR